MTNTAIYQDIATRTAGDIYIGVVGPVRTGKSTFIKRFMEQLVLPRIDDVYLRERARDELPQCGSGRTIMTAEPKFVPEEAVHLTMEGEAGFDLRLIDCVGYLVEGALGQAEDDKPRMVTTPWFDHEVPLAQAAEAGTRRVITEHSTIGILVTADGTFGDIPREAYVPAEERIVSELRDIRKPFCIVLNTADPAAAPARALRDSLEEKYSAPCVAVNCQTVSAQELEGILSAVLYEFPAKEYRVALPEWVTLLPPGDPLRESLYREIAQACGGIRRMREVRERLLSLGECPDIERVTLEEVRLRDGTVLCRVAVPRALYYRMLSQRAGADIDSEEALLTLLTQLVEKKREYDQVAEALDQVRRTGYGIVMPDSAQMQLEPPEILRQGSRCGVRLRASAPSIHLIQTQVRTEISPIVGTEDQSRALVDQLLEEFQQSPEGLWDCKLFGRSLGELVRDGVSAKLCRLPETSRAKLQNALERIVNEGGGGLICIIF